MKRLTFFLSIMLTAFFFFGILATAEARGPRRVYIKVAPPAAKVVVIRPASPWRDGVWVSGYWSWRHDRHVWVDGRWIKPKKGRVWVDGHWNNTPDGWEWIPGRWRKL